MNKPKITNPLNKMEHWKAISIYLVVYDVIAINFAFFLDYGFVLIYSFRKSRGNIFLHF